MKTLQLLLVMLLMSVTISAQTILDKIKKLELTYVSKSDIDTTCM